MLAVVTASIFVPLASQGSGTAADGHLSAVATETETRLPFGVAALDGDPRSTQARLTGIAVEDSVRPCPSAQRAVRFYARRIAEHRAKMGARATDAISTASGGQARAGRSSCPRYLARVLQRKARVARRAYEAWFRRTYEKWRCIHEHEGAWNDPNAPHFGGLQFDDDFQRTYGPEFFRRWGDAGNWPVWAQLLAAERAYRTRGFYPWPNTARACGLIG